MNSANSRAINNGQPIPDLIDKAPSDVGSIITSYLAEALDVGGITTSYLAEAFSTSSPTVPEEEKVSAAPTYSWTLNAKLGLFNNFSLRSIAHELVAGNVDAAIQGVSQLKGDCPTLMHEICEITDHRGRKLKGTLLQLAAMNFDFNPLPPEHMTKSFGAVEQLVELGLLSGEEIKNQLDAVLGPHSEEATKGRTDQLKAAVKQLVNDLVKLNSDRPNWLEFNWLKLINPAKDIIQQFRVALNQDGVITEGLVFDPQTLGWFIEHFWGNNGLPGWGTRLGGSSSAKSDLLWVIGFGSLQAADSACGLQLQRQGVYRVIEEKMIPSRAEHFSTVAPKFYTELASSSEFLSLHDGGVSFRGKHSTECEARAEYQRPRCVGFVATPRMLQECFETKNSSRAKIYADFSEATPSATLCNPVNGC